ncbi:hypothetical protein [Catenovulum sediminis]|uniref:hypothetical protein n=1 Tax=Catenovulum sediminis TaxID=1740262 RepID=UPI00117D459B|nr:hypothetical protein [Catenovulum sediminis]
MEWLAEHKVYLNIVFLVLAFISFLLLIRPLLLWYFGQSQTEKRINALQQQLDQQNEALEKILKDIKSPATNGIERNKALPPPTATVTAITQANKQVDAADDAAQKVESKGNAGRQEPTIRLD